MATVNKNFRIKHGLIVEGTTATINGENILTETGSDNYILNLIGGETLIKSVDTGTFTVDGSGNLTINSGVFDASGAASTAESNANSYTDTALGSYTPTSGLDAAIDGYGYLKSADLSGYATETYADNAADTAESNSNTYTDTQLGSYTTTANLDTTVGGYGYLKSADLSTYATQTYADNAASDALGDANTYTDNLIGDNTVDGTAGNTVKDRIDSAVAALVDGAPALLDTLNELAAAIADNPNYATDMATSLSGKQNTLTAGTGITIASDTISVTANTYDAYGAASTAQSNAETYADGVASTAETNANNYADGLAANYDPAGAASTAETNANGYTDSAISSGNSAATPSYLALNIGSYTKQVGNWVAAGTNGTPVTAYEYPTSWGSSEFLVRVMSNASGHQHSQLSKILITTDGAGNVGITEYGIVTTNGTMGDVTADISGGNVRIRVTPTYDSSEVIVSGTLLAYND